MDRPQVIYRDFQRFINIRETEKCHPQTLHVHLLGYDEARSRELILPWTGEDGLRALMSDFKIRNGEQVIFDGPGDYEHDPQNYKHLEVAVEYARNTSLRVGVVSFATELDFSHGVWDYAEVLIPADTIEGWHEVVGGEPVTDRRRRWNYPWEHTGATCRLVGRFTAEKADGKTIVAFSARHGNFDSYRIGAPDYPVSDPDFTTCRYQWFHPCIDPRGDIWPCPATMDTRALGNLGYMRFKERWPTHNTIPLQDCPRWVEGACPYAQQNQILHHVVTEV